ncbi:hypothetical protein [Nocardia otitidiscaviarum]|uniref:hypothetical protein n=1 Tax=Nocardia otitidiscaviarum TaxID=1823 RepID=UPI0011DD5818|nr:hypothetical protein [Nocardia otitidiscaviarum]
MREQPSVWMQLFGVVMDFVGAFIAVAFVIALVFLIVACAYHTFGECEDCADDVDDEDAGDDSWDRGHDRWVADRDGVL